jgi:NadR type nicotinamide-nucleotide adenylyltransferase
MNEKLRQKKSSCIKIVLFGPESTGKTTLGQQLSKHYRSLCVPEYSREYAENKLNKGLSLSKEDVLPIAIGQMDLENSYSQKNRTILFYDTNLLETKIYSEYIYDGFCPQDLKIAVSVNKYDLYLLTDIDIPWEFDAVRSSENDRNKMFDIFKNELEVLNLPYILLSGDKEARLEKAIKKINFLLKI